MAISPADISAMGKPFNGCGMSAISSRLADTGEQHDGQCKTKSRTDAAGERLEQVVLFVDIDDGNAQNRTVRGDERQINSECR